MFFGMLIRFLTNTACRVISAYASYAFQSKSLSCGTICYFASLILKDQHCIDPISVVLPVFFDM